MKTKNILLVEDNPDDEMLTMRAFQKVGYADNLYVVRDGAEAVDYLFNKGSYKNKQKFPTPDLIMLDLKLPKIDGREVLRYIRSDQTTRFIPVVVLTSSIEETDIVNCYELHGNSYIRKPIDFEHFTEVIKTICDYWLVLNHAAPVAKESPVAGTADN